MNKENGAVCMKLLAERLAQAENNCIHDEAEIVRLLMETKFFEPEFYLSEYQDVADDDIDPLLHFIKFGYKEKRKPNSWTCSDNIPVADTIWEYLVKFEVADMARRARAEFEERVLWPLDKIIENLPAAEAIEIIKASGKYDESAYLAQYEDLERNEDPIAHFVNYGFKEGRKLSEKTVALSNNVFGGNRTGRRRVFKQNHK